MDYIELIVDNLSVSHPLGPSLLVLLGMLALDFSLLQLSEKSNLRDCYLGLAMSLLLLRSTFGKGKMTIRVLLWRNRMDDLLGSVGSN